MIDFAEYSVYEGLKHMRYDFIPTDLFMAQAIHWAIKMKSESELYQWKC